MLLMGGSFSHRGLTSSYEHKMSFGRKSYEGDVFPILSTALNFIFNQLLVSDLTLLEPYPYRVRVSVALCL